MVDTIDLDDLRGVDLNLLRVLMCLLSERSTTRAAAKLGLGQPAVSAALARLREMYSDPLFFRVPRGMEPTARALELGATLGPVFGAIKSSLTPQQAFEPRSAAVTLRLGMPDNHEHFVLPALLARLQSEAPHARIVVRQTSGASATQMLDRDEIDLACGRIDTIGAWHRREALFQVNYLCLYDQRLTRLPRPLTLNAYLALPHLLASPRGDFHGVVDDALVRIGKKRRVILATGNFASLPIVLKRVPAIATLPAPSARSFARDFGLATATPPVTLTSYQTALVWLARHDAEPAHRWMRAFVRETVQALATTAAEGRAGRVTARGASTADTAPRRSSRPRARG